MKIADKIISKFNEEVSKKQLKQAGESMADDLISDVYYKVKEWMDGGSLSRSEEDELYKNIYSSLAKKANAEKKKYK
jgi:hypothetical protein